MSYKCNSIIVKAEVRAVRGDGSVALHTRSIKYGKVSEVNAV